MQRNELQFAEQRAAVYEYRLRGLTVREIAESTGTPRSTVHRWIRELTEARMQESQSELLAVELDRLDRYLAKLEQRLEMHPGRTETILPLLLKLSERRAKLLGLDAALKVDATVTETTQADIELAELIRNAQLRATQEVSRVRGEIEVVGELEAS